jgi:hypothetical protein
LTAKRAPAAEREERRLQRQRGGDRDERDQQAGEAERPDERHGHEEEERQADRDRGPGEDNRAACARHSSYDRRIRGVVLREFLAEAADDQQRVVDREPEPDQLDQVRCVRADGHELRRRVDQCQRAGDRARGEDERDCEREREPEHEGEHEQRQRQRERLAAAEVGRELRIQVVLDRRLPGDEGTRPDRATKLVRVRLGSLQTEGRLDVAVDDAAAGAERRDMSTRQHARRAV